MAWLINLTAELYMMFVCDYTALAGLQPDGVYSLGLEKKADMW